MTFPDDKELNRALSKLKDAEPSFILPKDASQADRLKYELCRQFVLYLKDKEMTQKELGKQLGLDPDRSKCCRQWSHHLQHELSRLP